MKLKSVSTYCQSAMSAGLIYTRDENGEIIRQHLVCRQMIVPLDGMPVISGDQLPVVRVDALKVTDDIKKERTYALRSRDGRTVLMVMKGMTARAAIMTDTAWISEAANEWLECLSNEAARVVRERGKDERAEGQ